MAALLEQLSAQASKESPAPSGQAPSGQPDYSPQPSVYSPAPNGAKPADKATVGTERSKVSTYVTSATAPPTKQALSPTTTLLSSAGGHAGLSDYMTMSVGAGEPYYSATDSNTQVCCQEQGRMRFEPPPPRVPVIV